MATFVDELTHRLQVGVSEGNIKFQVKLAQISAEQCRMLHKAFVKTKNLQFLQLVSKPFSLIFLFRFPNTFHRNLRLV